MRKNPLKRLFVAVLCFMVLSVSALAKKDDGDFPLTVHITAVHMEQGQRGISGRGDTDSQGNYSSSVGGGESYTWKLYTAQIEGDQKIYELSTPRAHHIGGTWMGLSAPIVRANYWLHIGNYHGRWNDNGTLEIQFHANGKLLHQTFHIEVEEIPPALTLAPASPAPVPTPMSAPVTSTTGIMATLSVESNVPGADIEIDSAFVGNTPSTVSVAPGSHQIAVKKKGFTDWAKTLNVTGGTIHLNAELEQEPTKK
jgi:hypothetical protein